MKDKRNGDILKDGGEKLLREQAETGVEADKRDAPYEIGRNSERECASVELRVGPWIITVSAQLDDDGKGPYIQPLQCGWHYL